MIRLGYTFLCLKLLTWPATLYLIQTTKFKKYRERAESPMNHPTAKVATNANENEEQNLNKFWFRSPVLFRNHNSQKGVYTSIASIEHASVPLPALEWDLHARRKLHDIIILLIELHTYIQYFAPEFNTKFRWVARVAQNLYLLQTGLAWVVSTA